MDTYMIKFLHPEPVRFSRLQYELSGHRGHIQLHQQPSGNIRSGHRARDTNVLLGGDDDCQLFKTDLGIQSRPSMSPRLTASCQTDEYSGIPMLRMDQTSASDMGDTSERGKSG
jgi:hypothetical protein